MLDDRNTTPVFHFLFPDKFFIATGFLDRAVSVWRSLVSVSSSGLWESRYPSPGICPELFLFFSSVVFNEFCWIIHNLQFSIWEGWLHSSSGTEHLLGLDGEGGLMGALIGTWLDPDWGLLPSIKVEVNTRARAQFTRCCFVTAALVFSDAEAFWVRVEVCGNVGVKSGMAAVTV